MKIGCIIQARMGSTRLPNKALLPLGDTNILGLIIDRIKKSRYIRNIVVATPTKQKNRPIWQYCKTKRIPFFKGNESNVLERYYECAKAYGFDIIIRITADCPFIDPTIIDRIIKTYLSDCSVDYVSNVIPRTYPDGLDAELITFKELKRAYQTYKDKYTQEHVTSYILNDSNVRTANIENQENLKDKRWTVDYPEDYEFIKAVYSYKSLRKKEPFLMEDILKLLLKYPKLEEINSKVRSEDKAIASKNNVIRSLELLKKAEMLIPNQTQCLTKGPTQYVKGVSPNYLDRGKGSHVWDVDGNEYIDYCSALGPVTLGYCYPAVDEAIKAQLKKGITFTLPHHLEVEVAELLTKVIPCAEMVRFGKNGNDVTSAAVRYARAYTNKDGIAFCGYHGGQDWYISTTEKNRGVPKLMNKFMHRFDYNDIDSLKIIFDKNKTIGTVIMEPCTVVKPKHNFLGKVQKLCKEAGAVLIFDEIVTGFRFSLGGAQEYFGVKPDLACFGKGMANGMPISALVGREEILKSCDDVFFSTTFGGECLSLAAAKATINEFQTKKVINHIWKQGNKIKNSYNSLAKQFGVRTKCIGYGCETIMNFENLNMKSLFIQEMAKQGILIRGVQNTSFSHSNKDIIDTLICLEKAMKKMGIAQEKGVEKYLEGIPVQPVFRKLM